MPSVLYEGFLLKHSGDKAANKANRRYFALRRSPLGTVSLEVWQSRL